jgi:hypothetical protein
MDEYDLAYDLMVNRFTSDDLFARLLQKANIAGYYFLELYIYLKPGQKYSIKRAEFRLMDNRYDFVLKHSKIDTGFDARWQKKFPNATHTYLDRFNPLVKKIGFGQYRYFFIPMVIDYGFGSYVVHQGGIILDANKRLAIVYEPYGRYEKMGIDYSNAIGDVLSVCFPDLTPTTFHKHLSLPDGLQSIILARNNAQAQQFNTEMDRLRQLLKQKGVKVNERKDGTMSNDSTVVILDYMDRLRYAPDPEIRNAVIELYKKFTSKTCVTLTLIELYTFFTGDVNILYKKIDVEEPNEQVFKLLKEIYMH